MKKIILLFVMLNAMQHLTAQNVGIGTLTPGEKLDVNGNVNVQGNVKVNGNAGTSGQVLMMNESGQQLWANAFGYKNRKEFLLNGTWTVPAGVREIMIEAVGAGGGGAKGGGGGSGGYAIGIYKVAPGEIITLTVPPGGLGASEENASGSNGGQALVSSGVRIQISSYGGLGGHSNQAGASFSFPNIFGDSLIYSKGFHGMAGSPTVESYAQYNAGNFVTIRKYGDGGPCMNSPDNISRGTFFSFNTATLANISLFYPGNNPHYGAGGGGGNTFGTTQWGSRGGDGLIAISW